MRKLFSKELLQRNTERPLVPLAATEDVVGDMNTGEGKHLQLYRIQKLAFSTVVVPIQIQQLNSQV